MRTLVGLTLLLSACSQPDSATRGIAPPASVSADGPASSATLGGVEIAWLPDTVARHRAHLVAAGGAHGVDPELLAIVTLVESGGWVAAESPSGARGLMQVMPATGAVVAGERGIGGHDKEKLFDPAYNVDFGAWYFGRQLARFGTADREESVTLAAAAYNGGPGRLRRHLDGDGALSEQTERYKVWVSGMWRERRAATSATFDTWRQWGGDRLLERARAEMR